jgi:hypothetical protein
VVLFELEDIAEEEEKGGECLILRTCGNVAMDGQIRQELIDFDARHATRMAPLPPLVMVEAEKLLDPMDVGLFGADRHMPRAHRITDLLKQLRWLELRSACYMGICRRLVHRVLPLLAI